MSTRLDLPEPTRAEHLGHRLRVIAMVGELVAADEGDDAARAAFNAELRQLAVADAAHGYLGALDVIATVVRLDPSAQGILEAMAEAMRAELATDQE